MRWIQRDATVVERDDGQSEDSQSAGSQSRRSQGKRGGYGGGGSADGSRGRDGSSGQGGGRGQSRGSSASGGGGRGSQKKAPERNARDLALEALLRVENGAFSHVLMPSMLRTSTLAPIDRAQVTNLVYSTLRGRGRVDYLLSKVLDRPLDAIEQPVVAGLRLGVQELLNGVAPHAAVGETVESIGRRRPMAKGFANGVLRSVSRLGPEWPWPEGDSDAAVAIRTSHPEWLVARLRADLGHDLAAKVLDANDTVPGVTLRLNPRFSTLDELIDDLEDGGVTVERGRLMSNALVVSGTGDPRTLPAVSEGRATPQDEASQAVAMAIGAQPGERILDICSAPGGKTTAIAEAMGDSGFILAGDRYAGRVRLVMDGAERLGLVSIQTFVGDARDVPIAPASFDRVLLDAPCSGLGVLRRRAEARWRISPDDPEVLGKLQQEMLLEASRLVKPGGLLAYSVCTLSSDETIGVDKWAQSALPRFEAQPIPASPWIAHGRGALLTPDAVGTDGMYLLLLKAPE